MKRLFAATAITIAAAGATTAMADNGLFIGGEIGKTQFKVEDGINSTSDKFKPTQYGIRVGSYIGNDLRVYANLNQGKKNENDVKLLNRQLTGSVDYLFNTGAVKPFVGATIGTNWSEFNPSGHSKKSGYSFAYGAQAGILGQVGQFDLELGYRYLKHTNEKSYADG